MITCQQNCKKQSCEALRAVTPLLFCSFCNSQDTIDGIWSSSLCFKNLLVIQDMMLSNGFVDPMQLTVLYYKNTIYMYIMIYIAFIDYCTDTSDLSLHSTFVTIPAKRRNSFRITWHSPRSTIFEQVLKCQKRDLLLCVQYESGVMCCLLQ